MNIITKGDIPMGSISNDIIPTSIILNIYGSQLSYENVKALATERNN
jgi:hypothetical protein